MLGNYLGDGGGGDDGGGDGVAAGWGADLEIEGCGAPEVAPSGGEGRRATTVLDGEEGDDDAEDGIRELADEITGDLIADSNSMGF